MKPKHIKDLQAQSRDLQARLTDRHTINVQSKSDPAKHYQVTVTFEPDGVVNARCNCPWWQYQGTGCSHVMAALEHLANTKDRTLSFWDSLADARRQKHRTFYLKGRDTDDGLWITSRAG